MLLVPHLGSLESLPFVPLSKTFETKRNSPSYFGQPAARAPSERLLVQYEAGSHPTRILPRRGTLHTSRFRLCFPAYPCF